MNTKWLYDGDEFSRWTVWQWTNWLSLAISTAPNDPSPWKIGNALSESFDNKGNKADSVWLSRWLADPLALASWHWRVMAGEFPWCRQ